MSNVHGDPYFDDPTGSEQLQTIETCSESSACLSPKAGQSGIGGWDQRWEGDNQVEGLQNMTNLMKLVKFSLEALKEIIGVRNNADVAYFGYRHSGQRVSC